MSLSSRTLSVPTAHYTPRTRERIASVKMLMETRQTYEATQAIILLTKDREELGVEENYLAGLCLYRLAERSATLPGGRSVTNQAYRHSIMWLEDCFCTCREKDFEARKESYQPIFVHARSLINSACAVPTSTQTAFNSDDNPYVQACDQEKEEQKRAAVTVPHADTTEELIKKEPTAKEPTTKEFPEKANNRSHRGGCQSNRLNTECGQQEAGGEEAKKKKKKNKKKNKKQPPGADPTTPESMADAATQENEIPLSASRSALTSKQVASASNASASTSDATTTAAGANASSSNSSSANTAPRNRRKFNAEAHRALGRLGWHTDGQTSFISGSNDPRFSATPHFGPPNTYGGVELTSSVLVGPGGVSLRDMENPPTLAEVAEDIASTGGRGLRAQGYREVGRAEVMAEILGMGRSTDV